MYLNELFVVQTNYRMPKVFNSLQLAKDWMNMHCSESQCKIGKIEKGNKVILDSGKIVSFDMLLKMI